ncbi:hypothetical protein FZC70_10395 [Bacillus subtilis]|nr:hypothetical protein FZC70_10395 [Bacillus subtilis]
MHNCFQQNPLRLKLLYLHVCSSLIILPRVVFLRCLFVKYFTFILCNISQTFAREKICLIYEQKRNHL